MFSSLVIQITSVGTKWTFSNNVVVMAGYALETARSQRNLFRYSSPDINIIGWRSDSILALDNAFRVVTSAINNVKHAIINNYNT